MTFGKSPNKKKQLSLSLLAMLMASCGADTPAFQEKAMSVLVTDQQSGVANYSDADNSADAAAARMDDSDETFSSTGEASSAAEVLEVNADMVVDVKDSQLRFGSQATEISTSLGADKIDDITYTVSAPAGKDPGKIVGNTYISPLTGTEAYEVKIIAVSKSDSSQSSAAVVKLEPKAQVFVGCTNDAKGFPIKADVFAIPSSSQELPDFNALALKTTTACMDSFQIPNRAWSDGFPGHPELIEWFALRASSHFTVASSGKYYFKLNSDDGAKLYIDGQLVVDNDGQHAQKAVTGSITLSAGEHELVMEYFQGPRYHIALELFWKTPGTGSYVYVPTTAFKP